MLLYLSIMILVVICFFIYKTYILQDNKFYNYKDVYPELGAINKNNAKIMAELDNLLDNEIWLDWKENNLYENNIINGKWKIIPLFGFGVWCTKNCKQFPTLYNILTKIPRLKLAIISKLKSGMKIIPHYGWGKHSNYVLRCHYGLKLKESVDGSRGNYVSVKNNPYDKEEEIQHHKLHDWIVFDDSKLHYAENNSGEDRIVLILDLDRPIHVKNGVSPVKESDELMELVQEMMMTEKT